jgi:hypothetical protein
MPHWLVAIIPIGQPSCSPRPSGIETLGRPASEEETVRRSCTYSSRPVLPAEDEDGDVKVDRRGAVFTAEGWRSTSTPA